MSSFSYNYNVKARVDKNKYFYAHQKVNLIHHTNSL